jgi:hypothetical protein
VIYINELKILGIGNLADGFGTKASGMLNAGLGVINQVNYTHDALLIK